MVTVNANTNSKFKAKLSPRRATGACESVSPRVRVRICERRVPKIREYRVNEPSDMQARRFQNGSEEAAVLHCAAEMLPALEPAVLQGFI